MKLFAIEGTIASGKSTLIKDLERFLPNGVKTLIEPLKLFETYHHYKPLKLLYENPKEYSVIAQMYLSNVFLENIQNAIKTADHKILIVERCPYSPVIFSRCLHEMGYLNDFQYDFITDTTLKSMKNINDLDFGADKIFFLDTDLELCRKRCTIRQRKSEKNIGGQYFETLFATYQKFKIQIHESMGDNVFVSANQSVLLKQLLMDIEKHI